MVTQCLKDYLMMKMRWYGHPDLYMDKLEGVLNTPDDSNIGYFIEIYIKYPDNIKEKTKNLPFAPENKIIDKDKYNDYLKKLKPKNYTKSEKLICDWTDEKKYLIHYRMLNFCDRQSMVVENFMKLFHLNKVNGWKHILVLIHKNEKKLKMILRKSSINYLLMLLLVNV